MADQPQQTDQQSGQQTDQQDQDQQTFTKADVDRIIKARWHDEKQKEAEIQELRKFKQNYEQQVEQQQQRTLEEQKEYEKLKETWQSKENEYKTLVSQREQEIQSMKIDNALTGAVMKSNAYPEAAKLIRENAVIGDDGKVYIKGKDSNGMEANLTVDDGVKQFLSERQYLVRADGRGGAGTGPNSISGITQKPENNLQDLSSQLQRAYFANDFKAAREIKEKINRNYTERGISRDLI